MSNERAINVPVQHEFKDYFSANLRWLLHKLRWSLLVLGLITIFVVSVSIYAWTHDAPNMDSAKIIAGFRPWYFIVPLVCVLLPFVAYTAAKKAMSDPRTKAGFKYHFSRDAIQIEGLSGRSELNWNAFVDAREVPNAFFLFLNRQLFHVIPKRCFAGSDDVSALREILREKFPKAKTLRSA
jgi:hypothetical protein